MRWLPVVIVSGLWFLSSCSKENKHAKTSDAAAEESSKNLADAKATPAHEASANAEAMKTNSPDSASLTLTVPELALAAGDFQYKVILTHTVSKKEQAYGPFKPGEKVIINDIVPGPYSVKVQKLDAAGVVVAEGVAAVDAQAGQVAHPTIALSPTAAKIEIVISEAPLPHQQFCVGGPAMNSSYTFKSLDQAVACAQAGNGLECANGSCGFNQLLRVFSCDCGPQGLVSDTEPAKCRRFLPLMPNAKPFITQCKKV